MNLALVPRPALGASIDGRVAVVRELDLQRVLRLDAADS
jgi:hypothetical protein